jgi:hypothetical protein
VVGTFPEARLETLALPRRQTEVAAVVLVEEAVPAPVNVLALLQRGPVHLKAGYIYQKGCWPYNSFSLAVLAEEPWT